jgi:hypothetical protein
MKKQTIKLKSLLKDARYDGEYFMDQYKQVWEKKKDGKYVKADRFDVYAHICKINTFSPKTQIYDYQDRTMDETRFAIVIAMK